MEYAIALDKISHSYGNKQVLQAITLKINPGEIFGLLGPSGAGKTTMIQIMTGQLRQVEGKAYILGQDTTSLTGISYREMGLMLDNVGLYERLSCYDNLNIIARLYDLSKDVVLQALEQVDLSDAKDTLVSNLSKGMRQRLLFARALMIDPKVLFLDEPTSGLDPGTAAQIHALIKRKSEEGATVFLTTHNMEEARKLCDEIALLHLGNIVEYGNPQEICNRYNHQKQLQVTLTTGEVDCLPNDATSAEKIKEYLLHNRILNIHSSEPTLETVFMELTGRGLE